MIPSILKIQYSSKEKLKRIGLYLSRRQGAKRAWKKRHSIVFEKHPEFLQSVDRAVEEIHRKIWSPFNRKFDNATLRICTAISGKADPLIIPEEIFQADIEPSLNCYETAHYLAHKSLYNRWFERGIFPEDIVHKIDGELLNADLNPITGGELGKITGDIDYPVVMKPNVESWGGNEINFINNSKQLRNLIRKNKNVVVQKKLIQHPELSRYHPDSLNTVRVYLYKSVRDNTVHIVNIAFRMGNGSPLDNVAAGGLISLVNEEGYLHGYALDRYGQKFDKHPITGLTFDSPIPDFEELKNRSIQIGHKLFQLRLFGLDLCYDNNGTWKAIEINTKGHSIRFAQYAGHPFFGNCTDEVIEYCKVNHWTLT